MADPLTPTRHPLSAAAGLVALLVAGALSSRTNGALFPVSFLGAVAIGAWCWSRPVPVVPREIGLLGLGALGGLVAINEFGSWSTVCVAAGVGLVLIVSLGAVHDRRIAVGGLVVGVALIGLAGILNPTHNDVVEAHRAASERVLARQSPYHDLGTVESNPSNYGAPIEGYSYPPIAIGVFALPARVLGGVGAVTLLLWMAIVALAVWRYGAQSLAAPGLALVPGLAISTRYGWTEPLTALLVLGALSLGAGRGRAALVGVAFASKQYLAFALPAVVAAWWRQRRWLLIAAASAVVVTLPVLFDLSGAYDALVAFHLDRPLRPDSSNLAGFLAGSRGWTTWPVPSVVVALVAGVAGAVVARRHGEIGWLHGTVVALAVTLVIGPVSLVNYWILVTVLLLLVEGERSREAVTPGP